MFSKLLKIPVILLLLCGVSFGQAHPRGRVAPKNLQALKNVSHKKFAAHLKSLPIANEPTWDSVALGLVGPIKDQSQCGSCWNFSGVCVVETAQAVGNPGTSPPDLAEEYVMQCLQNGGCNGDDNTSVLAAAKSGGLPLTSAYGPYTSGNGSVGQCKYNSSMKMFTVQDWGFSNSTGQGVASTQDIKNCIKSYGVVGSGVDASAFDNYQPGTILSGVGHSIDHDIALVGWDDSKGAWKLRNSWGTDWGNAGYMWIKYGAYDVGTEAVFAYVTPAPTPVPPSPTPPTPPGPTPVPPIPPVPPTPPVYTTYSGPLSGSVGRQQLGGTVTATVNGSSIQVSISGYAGNKGVSGSSVLTAGSSSACAVPSASSCSTMRTVIHTTPINRRAMRQRQRVSIRTRF